MEIETGQDWQNRRAAQSDVSRGVSGFLVWLMLWLGVCTGRAGHPSGNAPTRAYQPNRYWRRRSLHPITAVRDNRPYYSFSRPGLSGAQFMERLVALSGRGRVSVYRMRYWRKTVKGKAAPLGTEHEYWRDPLGCIGKRMAKLPGGVWTVHLWPGWRLKSINIIMTKLVY